MLIFIQINVFENMFHTMLISQILTIDFTKHNIHKYKSNSETLLFEAKLVEIKEYCYYYRKLLNATQSCLRFFFLNSGI